MFAKLNLDSLRRWSTSVMDSCKLARKISMHCSLANRHFSRPIRRRQMFWKGWLPEITLYLISPFSWSFPAFVSNVNLYFRVYLMFTRVWVFRWISCYFFIPHSYLARYNKYLIADLNAICFFLKLNVYVIRYWPK